MTPPPLLIAKWVKVNDRYQLEYLLTKFGESQGVYRAWVTRLKHPRLATCTQCVPIFEFVRPSH